jgi:hypothetical protein
LARRKYQQGHVYQKGRKQSDKWLPGEPAYVQFRQDIPGRPDLRHHTFALGICRTRTIAERTAAEKLEKLGINSTQHFVEATSNVTFKQQGEIWLKSLASRKRNPVEQTTMDTRRYALDKWMYPFFEGYPLADVNNRAMKEFVEHISGHGLSPATIRDYSNFVKSVVASAINEDGEELFPRTWNEEFIDAPVVKHQRQPSTDREGMEAILKEANEQYRVLYALLAGCGPMRAGEALGLEIDKHISEDCRTLYIRQKAKRGILQPYTKTRSGTEVNLDGEYIGRDVDLCSPLATMLSDFIADRKSGLLFCRPNGLQVLQRTVLKMSLHRILDNPQLEKGGFNIFRRFRITHIKTSECPDFLQHFWSGHASTHVSERYTKLLKDREFRLQWAEKIGTGFTIPTPSSGLRGLLIPFRKVG